MDGLAALLAMLRESARIGDYQRFSIVSSATMDMANALKKMPVCRRFADVLSDSVERFCTAEMPRLYTPGMAFQAGWPASWRDPQALPRMEDLAYEPRLGDQPEKIAFDVILHPELMSQIPSLDPANDKANRHRTTLRKAPRK
jgi:hypothetical protein